MEKNKVTMEKIVNLCKTRGFVFPGSEIYDGFANTWDFGPLGALLKDNVKNVIKTLIKKGEEQFLFFLLYNVCYKL